MEQYLIPALATVIIAIIEALAAHERRENSKERKATEERAEVRKKESRLSMDMMYTTSEMCDVLCIALQGGKTNGNVEEARDKAKKAREAYTDFLRDQTASKVS